MGFKGIVCLLKSCIRPLVANNPPPFRFTVICHSWYMMTFTFELDHRILYRNLSTQVWVKNKHNHRKSLHDSQGLKSTHRLPIILDKYSCSSSSSWIFMVYIYISLFLVGTCLHSWLHLLQWVKIRSQETKDLVPLCSTLLYFQYSSNVCIHM